jgi:hypothetical protein
MQTMNRETWLNAMAAKMLPRFEELGMKVPPFRVAVGFTSSGKSMQVAGECWHSSTSADNRFEILISPIRGREESDRIAATLAHELIHASVGFDCGHKGDFLKMALAIGFQRPVTHNNPSPEFLAWVAPFIAELGPIPHAKLSWSTAGGSGDGAGEADAGSGLDAGKASSNQKKKQKTRLLKACCAECGYTVRVTARWLEIGPPHCPDHGAMETEGADEAEDSE